MDHRRVKGPPDRDRQTGSARTDRASLTFRETAASTRTMPRVFLSPSLPLNLNQITFLTLTFWVGRGSGGNHEETDRQASAVASAPGERRGLEVHGCPIYLYSHSLERSIFTALSYSAASGA